jgi:ABC-type sugar transport system substrate-binding protein
MVGLLAAVASAGSEVNGGVPAGYVGAEAKLPTAYPVPKIKPGAKCKLGFQSIVRANETINHFEKAFDAEAKRLGCQVIGLDDNVDADKQVSNMQQLVTSKVQVIVFQPLDPRATVPVLKRAKAAGIQVLALDATFGSPKTTQPYSPYITSQVWQGRDIMAYLQAKAMAAAHPHAKVGLIGIGFAIPALKYLTKREAYWGKKFGLEILGTQDNPADDAAGGNTAANGLLQHYRDMDAIIGYNDPSAVGAYAAARGLGRKLTIVGLNGSSDGLNAVRSGQIASTVQVQPVTWGIQLARAAYSLVTKQNLPLPKIVVSVSQTVTKDNISSIPSWDNQIKAIK